MIGAKAKRRSSDKRVQVPARLEDLCNVGKAVASDLRKMGITTPAEIKGRDPYQMYEELCQITNQRHDPCMLDTFIAIVRNVGGEAARPWWAYTVERKAEMQRRAAQRK